MTAIAASLLYAKVEDSSEVSYLSKEEKREKDVKNMKMKWRRSGEEWRDGV